MEYGIILAAIGVIAIVFVMFYRDRVVRKGFVRSAESIEVGEDVASTEVTSGLEEANTKFELTTPMILAIFSGLLLLLVVFSTVKAVKKTRRRVTDLNEDEDGQAMTEFILIFPLLLFITLCIMQMALVYTGRLIINYSAFTAARAAVVVIPGTMGEETENVIDPEKDGGKPNRIRDAARLACTPASAEATTLATSFSVTVVGHTYYPLQSVMVYADSIKSAMESFLSSVVGTQLGSGIVSAADRYVYSYFFTQVKLLDENREEITESKTYGREPVTVRVQHAFYMGIPIANAFLGRKLGWDLFEEMGLNEDTLIFGDVLSEYTTSINGGYVLDIQGDCTMIVEAKAAH
ncbi:MAG: pilus assembly protein [Marinilabiliales bacterium]|nr:pilus assembly protein [Marinilabiliales bacterium]